MYRIGRSSESREKKFVPARALVAELNRALDIVQPDRGSPRSAPYVNTASSLAPDAGQAPGSAKSASDGRAKGAENSPPPRPIPGIPRRVYEGLITSGGIFYLKPALQLRLHTFYEYVEQGDRGAVNRLIWPLMEELVLFRDANAPFTWSDLAWPPRRAASGLRRWWQGRKK